MNYILDFADNLTEAQVQAVAAGKGITLIKQYGQFGNVYLGSADSEPSLDVNLVSVVVDDPNGIQLLGVDVTLIGSTETQTFDISENQNWWKVASINNLDFDELEFTSTIRGQNSAVYILDSGIKAEHPEFTDRQITLLHSFTGEFSDTNGHGTAIASVIAGNTCALAAPKLKIVKIFQNGTPTLQSDLVAALDATLNDFLTSNDPGIVNISWSIAYNEYINSKIEYMISKGMIILASAGNNGQAIADVTPACIDNVVVIGSYNQNLEPSNFSNYTGGSEISYTANETNYGALDGWAPGEQIWAANLSGGYSYVAGTSIATALASGAIAYNTEYYGQSLTITGVARNRAINNAEYNKQSIISNTFNKTKSILTLNGVYSGSPNFIINYKVTDNSIPKSRLTLIVRAGEPQTLLSTTPHLCSRITSDQDLPEHVTINEYGRVIINHPAINTDYLSIGPINLTLHLRNGELGSVEAHILITNENIDRDQAISDSSTGQITVDDPEIAVMLAASGGCEDRPNDPGGNYCAIGTCSYYCSCLGLINAFSLCFSLGTKSAPDCQCDNTADAEYCADCCSGGGC